MKLLLDTNVCIDLLRQSDGVVAQALLAAIGEGHDVALSAITLFELQTGVMRRGSRAADVAALAAFQAGPVAVEPFGPEASVAAARIVSDLLRTGRPLSACDALIAGHALALGACLVTADARLAAALDGVDGGLEVTNWRP